MVTEFVLGTSLVKWLGGNGPEMCDQLLQLKLLFEFELLKLLIVFHFELQTRNQDVESADLAVFLLELQVTFDCMLWQVAVGVLKCGLQFLEFGC